MNINKYLTLNSGSPTLKKKNTFLENMRCSSNFENFQKPNES